MMAPAADVNVRCRPNRSPTHRSRRYRRFRHDDSSNCWRAESTVAEVKALIVMSDRPKPQTGAFFVGSMKALLAAASPDYDFLISTRNQATFLHHRTTGCQRVIQPRQLVLHSICGCVVRYGGQAGASRATTSTCDHADVSRPCLGSPGRRRCRRQAVYPTLRAGDAVKLIKSKALPSPGCDHTADAARRRRQGERRFDGSQMVIGVGLAEGAAKRRLLRGIEIFAGYGMSDRPVAAVSHVRSKNLTGDPDGEVEFRARPASPALVDCASSIRHNKCRMRQVRRRDRAAAPCSRRAIQQSRGLGTTLAGVTCTPAISPWSMPTARALTTGSRVIKTREWVLVLEIEI